MPKIKLPVSGLEVEYRGLSFEDASDYLEKEQQAEALLFKPMEDVPAAALMRDGGRADYLKARRTLIQDTLTRICPEAWGLAKEHNRDVTALHKAVIKETFGDQEEQGNSSRSGDGQQTETK